MAKNSSSQNIIKKNLYHYRVIFSINNLTHEDDYLDVKEFNCDYLLHSETYAKEEFQRILQVIKKGPLPADLQDSSYQKANFNVALYLVRNDGRNEQKYLLKSREGINSKNTELENSILDKEYVELKAEYKKGLLRHPVPIYDKYVFRLKIIETKFYETREIEGRAFKIFSKDNYGYETFEGALKEARYVHHFELDRRAGYDPEDGDYLQVQLFMIENSIDGEKERLLNDNDKEYPLEEALFKELSDKSFMEYYNLRYETPNLIFGTKPLLWTKPPTSNFQKEGAPPVDLTQLTDDYYQDLPEHLKIWNSMDYYYLVFEGQNWKQPMKKRIFLHHNLQKIRQAAIDFFDNVILDHITGCNSSDNLPKVSLILIKKENNNPLYIKTADPSKERFIAPGMREEKEILESLGYSLEEDDDYPHLQP